MERILTFNNTWQSWERGTLVKRARNSPWQKIDNPLKTLKKIQTIHQSTTMSLKISSEESNLNFSIFDTNNIC